MKPYLVPPVFHGTLTIIYSKSPHKETRVTWYEWPGKENQWAELNFSKSCPSSTRTGGSCESRTGVGGHRAALKDSPARAAAIPSSGLPALPWPAPWEGTRRCRGLWAAPAASHPQCRANFTWQRLWKPLCCRERGNHTLPHQLKHTLKHATFSLRESIPLLFSTSVLSLIVCRKFKSALHFCYVTVTRKKRTRPWNSNNFCNCSSFCKIFF